MDKFHVGQRVRYKKTKGLGNILQERKYYEAEPSHKYDWYYHVLLDGNDSGWKPDGRWSLTEDKLEPVYDGDQASSWEECAWRPDLITKTPELISK
jgi:hypothetical protein